jgi:hypothetical protein
MTTEDHGVVNGLYIDGSHIHEPLIIKPSKGVGREEGRHGAAQYSENEKLSNDRNGPVPD